MLDYYNFNKLEIAHHNVLKHLPQILIISGVEINDNFFYKVSYFQFNTFCFKSFHVKLLSEQTDSSDVFADSSMVSNRDYASAYSLLNKFLR